jgi:hypothetical protein
MRCWIEGRTPQEEVVGWGGAEEVEEEESWIIGWLAASSAVPMNCNRK